jgi:hypothetical protein
MGYTYQSHSESCGIGYKGFVLIFKLVSNAMREIRKIPEFESRDILLFHSGS